MATRRNFRERRDQRRKDAEERQITRNSLSDAGQLDRLNKLGYTAQRERARLLARGAK